MCLEFLLISKWNTINYHASQKGDNDKSFALFCRGEFFITTVFFIPQRRFFFIVTVIYIVEQRKMFLYCQLQTIMKRNFD
jgi:hypothetical protein